MDQENMRIITVGLTEWVIKEEDDQYFHRPEGDYGSWQPGIPPGTTLTEVALAFHKWSGLPR